MLHYDFMIDSGIAETKKALDFSGAGSVPKGSPNHKSGRLGESNIAPANKAVNMLDVARDCVLDFSLAGGLTITSTGDV